MNQKYAALIVVAVCNLFTTGNSAFAQGTAFTYQGQLQNNGSPAGGIYDFTFALFDNNSTNTGQVGGTLTNLGVGVTNGLFVVTLDFGPGVFAGPDYWLAIGVRSNGGDSFAALNPLQEVTPTPYAIYTPNAGNAATASRASNVMSGIAITNVVITNSTFAGNGAGLVNLNGSNLLAGSVGTAQLAAGSLAPSLNIASTNLNAVGNTSYSATNASPTTIYLPANATIGSVVQITGEGAGGWAAQNPWIQTPAPVSEDWYSVASSADGTHLVAVAQGGGIYTSTNSGTTWTLTSAPINGQDWTSVASSSDGTHLVAVGEVTGGGVIYTSANSGATWSEPFFDIGPPCHGVASSADGSHLVVVMYFGGIYTSANYGASWTEQASAPTNGTWTSVASSSDGTHLVAVAYGGGIYTSVNTGTFWTEQTSASTNAHWNSVASSSDGSHLVAVVEGGGIYTSINSGTNWTEQTSAPTSQYWYSVASSADGSHLVAVASDFGIYTSINSGTNWTEQASVPVEDWTGVASSADGSHLVAVAWLGGIYTFDSAPIASGGQGTSASLEYLGNGQWIPETLSQASLPSDVVTNTGTGVTLSGAFSGAISGNGGGLTNVTAMTLASQYSSNGIPVAILTNSYTTHGTYSFTVPPLASNMVVELWGAGGGNSADPGGGGAFSQVTLQVTPGNTYVVVVGQAGYPGNGAGNGGTGGGAGSNDAAGGNGDSNEEGGGGQASSLFFYSNSAAYIMEAVAGGGGGGGDGFAYNQGDENGQPGQASGSGSGYAAGATNSGESSLNLMGGDGSNGIEVIGSFIDETTYYYYGGGGGGYGGGAYGYGYGGGSYGQVTFGGNGTNAGNTNDPDYAPGQGSAGQDGLAVVTFFKPGLVANLSETIQAISFVGNGAGLTNLNASQITGSFTNLTVNGSQSGNFGSPVALIENNNTNANTSPALRVVGNGNSPNGALSVSSQGTGLIAQFGNASEFVADITTNGTVDAAAFNGSGSGLTGLNASQLTSGTIPFAQLPNGLVTNNETSVALSGAFSGNGGSLTNVNATNATTLGGSQLDAVNGAGLELGTNFYLQNYPLFLRSDMNHGLAYNGFNVTNFGSGQFQVDGPVLWGYTGGALGVLNGGAQAALSWNNSSVTVSNTLYVGGNVVAGGGITGNGGGLTNLTATNLTGSLPAISGSNLTGLAAANITPGGTLPALNGVNLTNLSLNNSSFSAVASGVNNTVSGSTDSVIAGGQNNTLTNVNGSVIAGGVNNTNNGNQSTIGGGAGNVIQVGAYYALLGSGGGNVIQTNSDTAFLGAGYHNLIGTNAPATVLGGGQYNSISNNATFSVLGGGYQNTNTGPYSVIPGGINNLAASYSFAGGSNALAVNASAFVWSDGSASTTSTNTNSVTFRAAGGYRLFSGSGASGAFLGANQTSWSTISDRAAKKNFKPVDAQALLDKLATLPIQQWNYNWENDSDVKNIGPMAQDFKAAFYPGRDDKSITTLEFDGVELAAIQGLNQKLETEAKAREAEIQVLKNELTEQKSINQRMENRLGELEKAIARLANQPGASLAVNNDIKTSP